MTTFTQRSQKVFRGKGNWTNRGNRLDSGVCVAAGESLISILNHGYDVGERADDLVDHPTLGWSRKWKGMNGGKMEKCAGYIMQEEASDNCCGLHYCTVTALHLRRHDIMLWHHAVASVHTTNTRSWHVNFPDWIRRQLWRVAWTRPCLLRHKRSSEASAAEVKK